ncbi:MAG: hypothetical protein KI790_09235 [Cyclobacteriaceae bacterium]|nr:hypothetical protein [Cyclobacteriaceae bacterium HetDA_MAG_MS6]
MIKSFTENDLVRFIYDDLTENEKYEINNALITDGQQASRANELSQIKEQLEDLVIPAPQGVVDKILAFSKNYNVESA